MFLLGVSLALSLVAQNPKIEVWTNTQRVTGLVQRKDGVLFASTFGGLLTKKPGGRWTKQTVIDGLGSNELTGIALHDGNILVRGPNSAYQLQGVGWSTVEANPAEFTSELHVGEVKLKPFEGVFIGDKAVQPSFPNAALPAIAVAGEPSALVVGTGNHGLWELTSGSWHHADFNEPSGNSFCALAEENGVLYASTLEEGLARLDKGQWSVVPGLSSDSPREMVKVAGALWVRHANGDVDRFKEGKWEKDVLKSVLPRKEARFLATDGKRLFVAEWGGWSVLEDGQWKHELKRDALAGVVTTCLFPDGDRLWIGTQGKGVALADLTSDRVTWIDERDGMPDDWVTCLARFGEDVFAGTFVGGLVKLSRGGTKLVPPTKGENVTCPVSSGGELIVATRSQLYKFNGYNLNTSALLPQGQAEVQALCQAEKGLWIGTRTGLYKVQP